MSAIGLAAAGRLSGDDPVGSSVRYNREIVRIFAKKCVACHTAGGLSVPFDSYFDVRPWARAIREEILERRMPPWPAANGVRPLANDLTLTVRELAIITAWIDGQTPRGEPGDLPAAAPAAEWPAGKPDVILTLPGQTVPGDGAPHVRKVTIPSGLRETAWLRGIDVAPGERRALRSVLVFASGRFLGGWTPWHATTALPAGVAIPLAPNATLTIELHYGAWGEQGQSFADRSRLGLYVRSDRPAASLEQLAVTAARDTDRMRGESVLPDAAMVWAILPRLARGDEIGSGSVEVSAVRPDGGVEPLLWVREYRPDWQIPYLLREPARLPRGSRIVLTANPGKSEAPGTATASVMWYAAPGASPTAPTRAGRLRR